MIRMGFYAAAVLLMAGMLVMLTSLGLNQYVVLGASFSVGLPIMFFAYPWWVNRYRPASDITRLKAYLEASGARVIGVTPVGVQMGGRSGPDWRKYRAEIRMATGGTELRTIGVEVTTLGYSAIRDYDHPGRDGQGGWLE